jgi:hypothetical protein
LAVAAFQFRFTQNGFLHIALILAFLRLSYNICILPVQAADSKSTYYANQVDEILEITENQEVFWTGYPYSFQPELSLVGQSFMRDSISTPPLLAYQIPYYYALNSNSRLLYMPKPTKGNWLLGEKQYALQSGGNIYFEFKDKWTQNTLVLYQVEKS